MAQGEENIPTRGGDWGCLSSRLGVMSNQSCVMQVISTRVFPGLYFSVGRRGFRTG